jgi:hypothetical protein
MKTLTLTALFVFGTLFAGCPAAEAQGEKIIGNYTFESRQGEIFNLRFEKKENVVHFSPEYTGGDLKTETGTWAFEGDNVVVTLPKTGSKLTIRLKFNGADLEVIDRSDEVDPIVIVHSIFRRESTLNGPALTAEQVGQTFIKIAAAATTNADLLPKAIGRTIGMKLETPGDIKKSTDFGMTGRVVGTDWLYDFSGTAAAGKTEFFGLSFRNEIRHAAKLTAICQPDADWYQEELIAAGYKFTPAAPYRSVAQGGKFRRGNAEIETLFGQTDSKGPCMRMLTLRID